MGGDRCEGCGEGVSVAGGIGSFWTGRPSRTGGMTLQFEADGSEHFLCFECIDRLPDDPSAVDVAGLRSAGD